MYGLHVFFPPFVNKKVPVPQFSPSVLEGSLRKVPGQMVPLEQSHGGLRLPFMSPSKLTHLPSAAGPLQRVARSVPRNGLGLIWPIEEAIYHLDGCSQVAPLGAEHQGIPKCSFSKWSFTDHFRSGASLVMWLGFVSTISKKPVVTL